MNKESHITASIVIYNDDIKILSKAINSFIKTNVSKKLYLIDNSSSKHLKYKFDKDEIDYVKVSKNLGFGTGHNLVLDKIKHRSQYHLILNPDVEFQAHVIPELIQEIEKQKDVAMIAPKVVFPNGKYQYSCRRYPSVKELLARRLGFPKSLIKKGQYNDMDVSKPFYPDFLQGCFQLYKTEDFVNIGGFDERYFLYMEDVDICRKIDQIGKKKLYYPKVQITHILKKESSKNLRLFFTHLKASIKYFKKWGFR